MSEPKGHLVILALFFPPSRGSGVFRPLAMANYYVEQGWAVTVVTVPELFFERVTGGGDSDLLNHIDPRVSVLRVDFNYVHLIKDISRLSKKEADWRPFFTRRAVKATKQVLPDKYATWIKPALRALSKLHRSQPVNLVLATGNPWAGFEIARRFKAANSVPYLVDYRDSWTLNQFSQEPAFEFGSPEVTAERRIMAEADRVIMVNEPMRQWHAQRYPELAEKMVVVENGYDPDLYESAKFRPPTPGRGLRLGYVGTITAHLPHRETWAGWELARNHEVLADASVHVYGHLGFFSHSRDEMLSLLPDPATSGVTYEGPVAKSELGGVYDDLDVILMMIPSSRFVTAGKTYESMATGKAIVAIHSPDTAAALPMRGYPLAFGVAATTPEEISAAIIAAAQAARSANQEIYDQAMTHARASRRDRQLAYLGEIFDEIEAAQ